MPKNIDITNDRSQLLSIPAPSGTGILEHKDVADLVSTELSNKGLIVTKEEYRISVNQDVVQGVLHLGHPDNDLTSGLMFTWVNSYDRTTGFHCDMGSFSAVDSSEMYIEFTSKSFRRNSTDLVKHTREYIQDQINEGPNNFKDFKIIRDKFKQTTITDKQIFEFVGKLFFNDDITSSQ